MSEMGTLYLLHFEPPYKHARHYLGWTQNPESRFDRHLAGRGSPLVKAALAAGSIVTVARTWSGDRNEERRIKNGKNVPRLCPTCQGEL